MCGIIAAAARRNVAPLLLEGLRRLEYRGYDSAGMAIARDGTMAVVRCLGPVQVLADRLDQNPLQGLTGIAHTRWATHGKPSENNAHPQCAGDRIGVVHNGIIENAAELRAMLIAKGVPFLSQTDTEVIPHLILQELSAGRPLLEAFLATLRQLRGSFSLAVLDRDHSDLIYGARMGSPLLVGVGVGEHFLASDAHALAPLTSQLVELQDGDAVTLRDGSYEIFDFTGRLQQRTLEVRPLCGDAVSLGRYRHFMQKEIFEQREAVARTLAPYLDGNDLGRVGALIESAKALRIVACGTSYHAGLTAAYWFESLVRMPCRVEVASEFRYHDTVATEGELLLAISQSGETADTLAAVRSARAKGFVHCMAICNVEESSLVRLAEASLLTRAGQEVGVASTKAFTTQLTALALLVLALAKSRGLACQEQLEQGLAQLPSCLGQVLRLDEKIEEMASLFADKHHALFLGRGIHYPIALEGALKLKEISYIHAEAYPAGELKHGPLALVDEEMPVVAVAPGDQLLEKLRSNLAEVRARGGQLFVFGDGALVCAEGADEGDHVLAMPACPEVIAPIVYTIPLQLLAYHVAVLKGTDVDRPRNLAKSVTVE